MSTNPFRQPRPRAGIVLKQRVWNATEQGKDASLGAVTLFANDEYLWLGGVASVPLSWVEGADSLGPGLRLVWNNNLTGKAETATFCIRTFFGYDKSQRDKLSERILSLAEAARGRPILAVGSEDGPVCEICGEPLEPDQLHPRGRLRRIAEGARLGQSTIHLVEIRGVRIAEAAEYDVKR